MFRLLIIDDDNTMLKGIELSLEDHPDYHLRTASDRGTAIDLIIKYEFDLIISDLMIPDVNDGLAIIKKAKSMWYHPFVLTMTAFETVDNALNTMKAGADDFISKGFGLDELTIRIDSLLKKKQKIDQLEVENRILKEAIQEQYSDYNIIGRSAVIKKLIIKIEKVAEDAQSTCLIYGESGTGKDLVARNIHAISSRKNAPFVPINCAAIPENLIESELFGHEKGSFTSAHMAKQGKFELANKGIILLDEIGELPIPLQVRLLRVLEEKSFYRIGGKEPINVDVMILAATNTDLKKLVREGTFREDLFFRLNVISIEVPPLRRRKQDIPLLTEFFLDKFNRERKKRISLSPDSMKILAQYNFYGNVRELRNIIEDAFVLCEGDKITPSNLSIRRRGSPGVGDAKIREDKTLINYEEALEAFEKEYFERLLDKYNWNQREAARDAGISRKWLGIKIKRLGLLEV